MAPWTDLAGKLSPYSLGQANDALTQVANGSVLKALIVPHS